MDRYLMKTELHRTNNRLLNIFLIRVTPEKEGTKLPNAQPPTAPNFIIRSVSNSLIQKSTSDISTSILCILGVLCITVIFVEYLVIRCQSFNALDAQKHCIFAAWIKIRLLKFPKSFSFATLISEAKRI